MITYILQYQIPLKMNFLDLGHDLIDIISSNMDLQFVYVNSQCQVISHLHVMTYLFDSPNTLNS